MTNKELSLKNLNTAMSQYNSWFTNIKMLRSGIKIEEDEIRVNPTSCPLYIWLTEDLHNINFGNQEAVHDYIKDILSTHSQNFIDYDKIRDIYFPKKSALSKIFTSNKISENDKILISLLETNIRKNSKKMLEKIERISVQLKMAHESRFSLKEATTQQSSSNDTGDNNDEVKNSSNPPRYYRGQIIE